MADGERRGEGEGEILKFHLKFPPVAGCNSVNIVRMSVPKGIPDGQTGNYPNCRMT